MVELLFAEQPAALLDELVEDPTRVIFLGRLNTALDALESNPGSGFARRRRYSNIGCWALVFLDDDDDEWLIMWDYGENGDDEDGDAPYVVVRAIVRSP